ncbi:spatacsin isoform X2 [Denticeps clupeoides]|uniref:spatacsin isoform X2 n=1 Tax=Denticeps clupeoides TaxID=299321 RepID=UPI0010A3693D|nr:spatacsin isoform X2 [Denticeps clupeoides]
MLPSADSCGNAALEVALVVDADLSRLAGDTARAKMAKGRPLVGCVSGGGGRLTVTDVSGSGAAASTLRVACTDFAWEETRGEDGHCDVARLLAVGSNCDLWLYVIGQESVDCVSSCSSHALKQMVERKELSVTELVSSRVLSFSAGRSFLLLNMRVLVQLLWEEGCSEPELVSCCSAALPPEAILTCADCQLCRGTLFMLTSSGLIYVFDSGEGRLLASVDLPLYHTAGLGEDDPVPALTSFSLLQVSEDLSTAVAATSHNLALVVDLNAYFRTHPEDLLCCMVPVRPSTKPQDHSDQDSLSSSAYSQAVLGSSFQTDCSWEAQMKLLYKRSRYPPTSHQTQGFPWFRDFPHIECRRAAATAKSSAGRVAPGGAVVLFKTQDRSAPATLAVSEFSVVLTFLSPDNRDTVVAYWDLESQTVTYHQPDSPCVPVQRSDQEGLCLLLKASGLSLVLFAVSQEELLNRLMVFGSAGTVDSLCHLNVWGRCSIPIHALEAGLKNHQLDTVDFFLKSKANVLYQPAGYSTSEPAAFVSTQTQLRNVKDLCPALDLLHSSIRDTHTEAQSRQFSEQLLSITLTFLNTQVRLLLSNTEELDESLQECVHILDAYISDLRTYLKFSWPAGGETPSPVPSNALQSRSEVEDWGSLSTEEVIQRAIMTNQIPRAQAFLRKQGSQGQRLEDLRKIGLVLAFRCLTLRDLDQATTLLRNMGFSVKKQLHSICLYTEDRDLRGFVVEELKKQKYLSEEEEQRVDFIERVERLCSSPAARCGKVMDRRRVVQAAQSDPESKRLLQELVCDCIPQSEHLLMGRVRLDWVRHWDSDTQKSIMFSRMQTPQNSCDPAVLWAYLTSLHDQHRVNQWIQSMDAQNGDPSTATQWPTLTADVVNSKTQCSIYMRNQILDMLAKRGVFVQAEMADFEQLLWRLGQAGGVMQANVPVPQFRSVQGRDFHSCFISYCLDHGLQYLLYTYLEHYRLTPRNCLALADKSLYESHPWFEMLVKMQEIPRDLTDPGKVFQASLTSVQVLTPGSPASVSSMLLEGHSLLALCTIMFAPGGVDQVVWRGERAGDALWKVDPQLLKMALSPYPKLKSALFPQSTSRGSTPSDISIYHLMQSLNPLDASRLFGWQSANTLGSTEVSAELPHFSSPHLVSKHALIENLDFLYYLQHGRPSVAYGTFLVQHLLNVSGVEPLVTHAAEQAYCLALQNFSSPSVTAACVCFCELLGVCSLKLRVDLKALNFVLKFWSADSEKSSVGSQKEFLVEKGSKLAEKQSAEELLVDLENAVRNSVEGRGISRSSYEAGQEWALPVQFCQLHGLSLSPVYPCDCAADGQWLHFLLFVQLHSYPPKQVRALLSHFSPALRAHLSLAFQDLQLHSQWKQEGLQGRVETLPRDASMEAPRELFQVLLQSQEQPSPWRYLLGEAMAQHCPPLTVFAACHQESDHLQCLCVWILTSVEGEVTVEATAHIDESPSHHVWNLHDLSVIWKTLLRRSKFRPLIRGFQLFQRDSPLIHMLRMYELCYDYKNYPEAKTKLHEFQKCLFNLRGCGAQDSAGIPVQWVESQASVLLFTMMQQCGTQYELRRLLQLLADMERLLKSNGPDFKKLSLLSQVLQDTPVSLSACLLETYSPDALQRACQEMLEQLQALGLFSQARQVAELAGLPLDSLLINELLKDLQGLKAKRQWQRKEARLAFWRKCHNQLRNNGTSAVAASEFFLSQAEQSQPEPHGVAETELLCVQERCVLLSLSGFWLSQQDPVPLAQLEEMEKRLWSCRLRQQVILTVLEKESIFATPVGVAENSFDGLVREFSFSKVPMLNDPKFLSLDCLPSSATMDDATVSSLDEKDQSALAMLVGQLLDEGSIYEASRVCRYFSYSHRDVRLVLHCRGLASGELQTGMMELLSPEAMSRRSFPSTSSLGSLSSFVVVPSPEDQVVTKLQMLVDECYHGKNYCKQVLSLYELSKELQCSYSEISGEAPEAVLRKVLISQQPERYKKAQAFISVQGLQPDAVAQLVSSGVVQGLLTSGQEGESEKQMYSHADGREAFLQLAKLCGDPNLVGIRLLDLVPTVPLAELSCTVELLILSHDCFSLTCNMEGIVRVLQAARHISHTHLAHSERYSLLVRLLTGIGRYNDMTYIFDLLNQNHRFEMLLRKKVESNSGLKTALLDYIKRCLPGDSEKYNMVALCFSMCREIGENHEGAARTQLKIIESQPWAVTPELKAALLKVLTLLKDAAESYSKDSCVRQAVRCVKMAKLVTLQLHLLSHGQDQRVINLRPPELPAAVLALPHCYQSFVIAEAYDFTPDWAEVLYQKVILNGNFSYLDEFKQRRSPPASLFEEISKKVMHNKPPGNSSQNLKKLLQSCQDVYMHYKLAYEHKFFDVANMLIQESKTNSYLSDRLGS